MDDSDQWIQVDGASIRFRQSDGDGPPVVFIHGKALDLDYWNRVRAHLPDRRTIAFDLVGHGRSDRPPVSYDLACHHRYLVGFLDALDVDRAVLVGHSYGGVMAAWHAAIAPDRVAAVGILQASARPEGVAYAGWRRLLMRPGPLNRVASAIAGTARVRSLLGERQFRQNLGFTASAYEDAYEATISGIAQPTVVSMSHGDEDVHYWGREGFISAIPHAECVDLPFDVGHHGPRQAPQRVAAIVERLVQEVLQPDSVVEPTAAGYAETAM